MHQALIQKEEYKIRKKIHGNLQKYSKPKMTQIENPIYQQVQTPSSTNEKHQEFLFSDFQNKFETIKAFVEDLRQFPIQITAKEDSHILRYTKIILDFLQHPQALKNEKLYRNSIISLGNFLGIKYSFLGRENVSDIFFKNLIDYFAVLCEHQQQSDFNVLVYPVFYIIVVMIYNSDKETSKKLFQKVFVKKFMRALCSVDFKEGNKIERYLPVMIAFIAKGLDRQESNGLLKQLVLRNLHFSQNEKNSFQFIYSLRVLINKEGFTLGQVRKYSLLQHLGRLLEFNINLQQQVSMVIEVLRHILKRHQILGYRIVNSKFLGLLEKAYKVCPEETLGLLEIIIPCLTYQQKLIILEVHSERLRNGQNQMRNWVQEKQIQSLKIVSMIVQEMPFQDLLRLLQVFSLEKLLKRSLEGEKVLINGEQQLITNFVIKIMNSIQKENKLMCRSFLHILRQFKEKNKKLAQLTQKYIFQSDEIILLY